MISIFLCIDWCSCIYGPVRVTTFMLFATSYIWVDFPRVWSTMMTLSPLFTNPISTAVRIASWRNRPVLETGAFVPTDEVLSIIGVSPRCSCNRLATWGSVQNTKTGTWGLCLATWFHREREEKGREMEREGKNVLSILDRFEQKIRFRRAILN